MRCRPIVHLAAAIGLGAASAAGAQSQYRNLEAGRPLRVEDAEPTARYSVDIDLASFQLERLTGGTMRYRAEPRIGYGILPFTEIELRVPIVQVTPPSGSATQSVAGIAGISLGAMRALNLETTAVPAMAIAGEVSVPVGSLAPNHVSYLLKGLLTKTTALGRVHINAGFGTWAVRPPSMAGADSGCSSLRVQVPGETTCGGNPPIIIDAPCTVVPAEPGEVRAPSRMCMPPASGQLSVAPTTTAATSGSRWFAGAAFDRSLPIRSLLLAADVFAERFVNLYPIVDWTAEVGFRYQLTPLIVLDAGAGRHFAGVIHSTTATVGATYELATPPWIGR